MVIPINNATRSVDPAGSGITVSVVVVKFVVVLVKVDVVIVAVVTVVVLVVVAVVEVVVLVVGFPSGKHAATVSHCGELVGEMVVPIVVAPYPFQLF